LKKEEKKKHEDAKLTGGDIEMQNKA